MQGRQVPLVGEKREREASLIHREWRTLPMAPTLEDDRHSTKKPVKSSICEPRGKLKVTWDLGTLSAQPALRPACAHAFLLKCIGTYK